MVIREVEPGEVELLPALCVLLQDCVEDGASVGFLAPLSHADAFDYWRGIAQALMTRMESFARASGLTLLVLDTEASSGAEALYTVLGWHRVGEIPDFGARPDGELRPTAVYYKRLAGDT